MTKPNDRTLFSDQQIAASEQRLRALVNATSDIVYSLNADWSVMRELDGRGFLKDAPAPTSDWRTDNVYPGDLEKVNAAINKAINEKDIYQLEHRVWRADRTIGWTLSRAVPILDDRGEIIEWFGVASDITERKQAEEDLRKAKEQSEQQKRIYETITSGTPDLMYVFGLDYRFTYANAALLTMWGKNWDNAVGKGLRENGYEEWHAEMHEREIDQVRETKQPIRGEVSFPHATLGRRVYDYILTPVFNNNGEVEAVSGTTRDVTERKLWEEKLKSTSEELQSINEELTATNEELIQSQQQLNVLHEQLEDAAIQRARIAEEGKFRLEAMIMNTPIAMSILKGEELMVEIANEPMLAVWRRTLDQVVGRSLVDIFPELRDQPNPARMREVLHSGKRFSLPETEVILGTVDGELKKHYARFSYDPISEPDGTVGSILITVIDITEEVTNRRNLEQSRAQLQGSNEEIAATNEELTVSNEELKLVNQQLLEAQKKIEEGEVALRLALDAADFGTWFIHSGTREFITDARLKELFGYYPDESLSIEQALAQITEEYRGVVAKKLEDAIYNSGDYDLTYPVIGLHDNQLRWLRAIGNLKTDHSGGFSAFTGVVMDVTDQYLAAQKVERAEESLRIATESGELGTWYYESDTERFETSARFNQVFGFPAEIQPSYAETFGRIREDHRVMVANAVNDSFTTGAAFKVEYAIVTDGKERWVRSVGKMVSNEGSGIYVTGVLADITEQKQDEMRKNDFIGMVSHELKTPLTSLTAILQVLNAKLKKNEDSFVPGALEKANQQVKKMTAMINGFLNISRLESGKIVINKQPFILGDLVKEQIEETNLTGVSHIIELHTCEKVVVTADRDKIGSVLSNLLSNAVKYSPKGSKIAVDCDKAGKEVMISVNDQGLGIRPEDTEKVFDRFYRVESNYTSHISGFGIGLYLSAEIIHRHNGRIWVESEIGKGSTFYFSLPLKA